MTSVPATGFPTELPTVCEARFIKSAATLKDMPALADEHGCPLPEIAMVGRSNVGKSSFINGLLGRKQLAKTSNTPGTTRLINVYQIVCKWPASEAGKLPEKTAFIFADLPGYGYAKVSKTMQQDWQKHLQAYLRRRETLKGVIQLLDARHDPMENDIQMLEWLFAQQLPVFWILTKADKLTRQQLLKQQAQTSQQLRIDESELIAFSGLAGQLTGHAAAWQRLKETLSL